MTTSLHKDLPVSEIHATVSLEYANAAARTGDTSLTTADKGRIARQTDNDTYWILQDETPTWIQITSSMPLHDLGGSSHSADTLANLNSKISDATLDDSSSARTPTSHATSHQSGGSDAIKLDDLAAPDDNTDLDASTSKHGLLKKLGGGTTNFLRADGAWAAPVAVFGAGHQRQEVLAEASTTGEDTVRVTLTTGALAAGTYRVGFGAGIKSNNKACEVNLYNSTDAAQLLLYSCKPSTYPDDEDTVYGVAHLTLTGTSKTLQLRWGNTPSGSDTIYIRNAFIEIWRVA